MTVIKTCDFEAGNVTGTGGFTSATGSPTIDTTSLIKGVNCCSFNWANVSIFGTNSGLNQVEIFISLYFRITTLPASSVRIIAVSNGTTQGNIIITSTGTLQCRNGSTNISTASSALSTNTTYRIGFHSKCSTALANADEIIEGFVALGDANFGSAFGSSSAELMATSNANFTQHTAGNTNSSTTTSQIFMDDIIIDDSTMPGPSIVGLGRSPMIYVPGIPFQADLSKRRANPCPHFASLPRTRRPSHSPRPPRRPPFSSMPLLNSALRSLA